MGTFLRSRRPLMPLALIAATTAFAYAISKRQKSADHSKARLFQRKARSRA